VDFRETVVLADDFLDFLGGFLVALLEVARFVLVLPANSHTPRSQFMSKNEALGGSMSKLFAFYHRGRCEQSTGAGDFRAGSGANRASQREATGLYPLVPRPRDTVGENHRNLIRNR
jgi:hypothetical protein